MSAGESPGREEAYAAYIAQKSPRTESCVGFALREGAWLMGAEAYRKAGVDLEAAERAVELMKRAVVETHGEEVLSELSEFAGLFALRGFREPVLISATDGVGTKLKIAFAMDKHDTVGQDLVAMCVDDIVCHGARPLFFLDYLACGKLEPEKVAEIVGGIARACKMAGCALIGGETAELPGFYAPGEYDLAGFAVGAAERGEIITGREVKAGDVVMGLASSGLHSNGYSLARKVLLEQGGMKLDQRVEELGRTVGEELLEPTRIYAPSLVALFEAGLRPAAIAHVTGGGIAGNLSRVIPDGLCARISRAAIPGGAIFELIARLGGVSDEEMLRVFNMGVGMVLVADRERAQRMAEILRARGEKVLWLGEIAEGEGPKVVIQ